MCHCCHPCVRPVYCCKWRRPCSCCGCGGGGGGCSSSKAKKVSGTFRFDGVLDIEVPQSVIAKKPRRMLQTQEHSPMPAVHFDDEAAVPAGRGHVAGYGGYAPADVGFAFPRQQQYAGSPLGMRHAAAPFGGGAMTGGGYYPAQQQQHLPVMGGGGGMQGPWGGYGGGPMLRRGMGGGGGGFAASPQIREWEGTARLVEGPMRYVMTAHFDKNFGAV